MGGSSFKSMNMKAEKMRIRAHHLLCLHYFEGKGYSEGFIKHLTETKARLEKENPEIEVVCELDEICTFCPNQNGEACASEAKVRRYDQAVVEKLGITENTSCTFQVLYTMAEDRILRNKLRPQICGDCQWNMLCEEKDSNIGKA